MHLNVIELSTWLFAGALFAGFLGALTGLGGGVVIVPLLTLVFGIDIRYAIGASLVSVIATSSGAASAFVRASIFAIRPSFHALRCHCQLPRPMRTGSKASVKSEGTMRPAARQRANNFTPWRGDLPRPCS